MNLNKYKFFDYIDKQGRHVVVAVSRHAGRSVKGYAKCDVNDEFDLEIGKRLAAARCNLIVQERKLKTACGNYETAKQNYAKAAEEKLFRANRVQEITDDVVQAETAISNILIDIFHK